MKPVTSARFLEIKAIGVLTFTINFNSSHFYHSQFTTEYEEGGEELIARLKETEFVI